MAGDPLFDISGKVALVTGGTSGIGLMIARGYVRRGVRTYIAARDKGRCEAVAAELSALGECRAIAADLGVDGGAEALAKALAEREDKLHILVNNAGVDARGSVEEFSHELWDMVFDLNVRSLFFLTQGVLPLLKKTASASDPARIINIGSIGGLHVPNWEAHAYGASKAGVHHITRSLAKRLGRENIVVNAIAPGPFPTGMTDVEAEGTKKAIATYIPLGRPGQADDMEGVAVFLASRAGAYINGHTLPLEGGYIAAL
ncbi:MAG TPA: SDR family oxidoreductase [Caulobacterales bacterium]|nr:SDR family oxidoreductase [Caulobacterales bacterium]